MIRPQPYQEIEKYSSSVGLLIDRCVRNEQAIGTVWLVDTDKVATCAHLIVLYADFLRGLKVFFPASSQTFEIVEATFHPKFDRQVATEMAQRSLSEPVPALALQDNNVVILKLSRQVSHLDRQEATTFNKKISLAPMPRLKGLAGSVEEIGMALVIQTVTNARKDGVLYISDERNRPVARLFFREGKITYAKFGKLNNEQAIYQMFLHDTVGQFHLKAQPTPDWEVADPMVRSTDGLLLEAHRRLDETPKLLEQLGGPTAMYARVTEIVNTTALPPEVIPAAEKVWPHLDGGVSIDQLWDVVNLDSYSIYAALLELAFARQIAEVPQASEELSPMQPLEMAPWERLSPWDEVINLTPHPTSGRAQMRRGNLVGLLRPHDPYHLLHTLMLPYRAAGSPLLKGDRVVGVHCGMLPLDPGLHALPHHLHQMLWVDAVQNSLTSVGKPSTSRRKSVGMTRLVETTKDQVVCPKCQSVMVRAARFCGKCGQKL